MPPPPPLALSSSSDRSQHPKIDTNRKTRTLNSVQPYQLGTSSASDTLAPPGVATSADSETVTPIQPQAATHPTSFSNVSYGSVDWSQWSGASFDHDLIGAPTPTPTLPINGADMLLEMLEWAMSWTSDDAVYFIWRLLASGVLPRERLVMLLDPRSATHPPFSRAMARDPSNSSTTKPTITTLPQIYGAGSAPVPLPVDIQPNGLFYNLGDTFDRSSTHIAQEPGLQPSSFPHEFVPNAAQVARPSTTWATVSPTSLMITNSEFRSEQASHLQTMAAVTQPAAHEQRLSLPPAFLPNAPHSAPASSPVFNTAHGGSKHASHLQTLTAVTQPAAHGQQFFLPPAFLPTAPHSAPASLMAFTSSHCGTEHASHLQTMTAVMQPAGHRQQQNKRASKKPLKLGHCTQCGADRSTQWRRHPVSKESLCNKCGQKARKT
ncbi:hypothetical protein K438DRAFT_1826166 [Mycena galopus ATCC 62051]|nr:hypothetical protein K438DRAFT_1826166 [Mycena galopus ATCC 62051]